MRTAGTALPDLWKSVRAAIPVDLGWRNVAFSLRTACAAVVALAAAYWLELQDPQWAALTVYLLAQPTAGAAVAKGAFRIVGTLGGAAAGLVILGLWSQAPLPLIGSLALWLGLCFTLATQRRNYAAYSFLLAGYTALLVGLEGAFAPTEAWHIAFDRTAEIVIGIACITAVSVLVFPVYAGDVLRGQLVTLFGRLCHYGAVALQPRTPQATFAALRREMVEGVVKFDALRSYTVFEAPEMRASDAGLRRMTHEFLRVLAVARGLYVRLDDFQVEGAGPVADRLGPVMADVSARLERLAGDPSAFRDPRRVRSELLAARVALNAASADLEAMTGRVPFVPLADGVLILRRAGDLLHGLSMVMVSEAASLRPPRRLAPRGPAKALPAKALPASPTSQREAWLAGLRAGLVLLMMCGFWAASEWADGFNAASGLAVLLFFAVNQDRPGALGFSFLLWTALGMAAAFLAMVFVLPRIEGFEALGLFLVLAMFPAGLMAGTPQMAWAGIAFGGFFVAEIGTGNVFQPDEAGFFNATLATLFGMALALVLLNLLPVNSRASRRRLWATTLGTRLPEAARGVRHERVILREIVRALAELLPRLALARPGEDDFLRGTLGAASTGLELGRLRRLLTVPELAESTRGLVAGFLDRFAAQLEAFPAAGRDLAARVGEAEATAREAAAALAAIDLPPGSPAAGLNLRAGASLRFIADRFDIDRPFFLHAFGEA
ncbi:putative membrane protein YccC [Ancylobacter aquaticus]|uniref:Putative membrane protein YccC n=1 Tax=Ancylobacter aquaticus TaxID=100 RepID=A0A4R1I5Q5_ANCAQ|nr:FUSC family protein [Ancylobacter aquaticus]TCK30248.1 putative membrane protein YccC [Ancylobacter aquaticus]